MLVQANGIPSLNSHGYLRLENRVIEVSPLFLFASFQQQEFHKHRRMPVAVESHSLRTDRYDSAQHGVEVKDAKPIANSCKCDHTIQLSFSDNNL